jgi:hypothetical protein
MNAAHSSFSTDRCRRFGVKLPLTVDWLARGPPVVGWSVMTGLTWYRPAGQLGAQVEGVTVVPVLQDGRVGFGVADAVAGLGLLVHGVGPSAPYRAACLIAVWAWAGAAAS